MVAIANSGPADGRLFMQRAATGWFVVTLIGQLLFLAYITGFYGPPVLRGTLADWSKYRDLIDGYVAGDTMGNLQFGIHILMAAILTFGGVLQLWPALRNRVRAIHRWNGRVFVLAALVASIGGLWLVWVRGSRLGVASSSGITLNAALILIFVGFAWQAARLRDFATHRRWAVRAFLAVSGVWFLRVGLMAFGLIATGLLGLPKELSMSFFAVWSFGSYLVPLAVFQLYLGAEAGTARARYVMGGSLAGLTLLMAVGIAGASLVMWYPSLKASGLFG